MKDIKLISYSTNGIIFEDLFDNMTQLKEYVKQCGGFKQIGDYEIYTQDNQYRYNKTTRCWDYLGNCGC